MGISPRRPSLYRRRGLAVILAVLALAALGRAQFARKAKMSEGPRALGLLELAPNGKAHLIPITILYQGQFYDAGAYKASPVPMALEPQTVYEGMRSGASLGLFTITGVRQLKNSFIADGIWQPAGQEREKTVAAPVLKAPQEEQQDKPPVLRRPGPETEKPQAPAPTTQAPQPSPAPQSKGDDEGPPTLKKPSAPAPQVSTPAPSSPAEKGTQAETAPEQDSGRPVLRRGKPVAAPEHEEAESPNTAKSGSTAKPSRPAATGNTAGVQLMPAISDAHGPEPHSYVFDMTTKEEQEFRQKLLAMATAQLREYRHELVVETIDQPSARAKRKQAPTPPQPSFEDVQLRAFDLSDSNEPTLVFTAKAHIPASATGGSADLEYYITLVARNDIYNELHKGFANVTDSQHLDVIPELQLIDAVDADGDGRGELLFRSISDSGGTYVIYRVIGDQLYALYEGTTGG